MTRVLDGLRLLLGAVMVVTALRYFLPPLLPFVPEVEWNDPMAVRLGNTTFALRRREASAVIVEPEPA